MTEALKLAEEAKHLLSQAMLAQADARESGDYSESRKLHCAACRSTPARGGGAKLAASTLLTKG